MLIELFILLFLVGLGSLVLAVKTKHVVLSVFATIIFLVLALQVFELDYISGGTSVSIPVDPVYIGICWILGLAGFIITLVGAVSILRSKKEQQVKL